MKDLVDTCHPMSEEETSKMESKYCFKRRTIIRSMLFALAACRVDIGHAISTLSIHSNSPPSKHFEAAQNLCIYLIQNKEKGLIFKRPKDKILNYLPSGEDMFINENNAESEFEEPEMDLIGCCDASHETDHKTRRSTTGCAFCMWSHFIFYKVKLQNTVATSSVEAEFIASLFAAKTAKYLRTVLIEINQVFNKPTIINEDNVAAIFMTNIDRPTDRARHVDVRFFALQQWVEEKHVVLHRLPGIFNPSDSLTKALSWILHSRQTNRLMGHFKYKDAV